MRCLHCNKKIKQGYCEEYIQNLLSENINLQFKIKELEEKQVHIPKHLKEDKRILKGLEMT